MWRTFNSSRSFLDFPNSIVFGLIQEELASIEPVILEFQLVFDNELDGFRARIQIRSDPVRADGIIAGDPLLGDTTNPAKIDSL